MSDMIWKLLHATNPQVSKLEDTCSRQADYINQLEDYANSVEAANAQLMQQVSSFPGMLEIAALAEFPTSES